MTIVRVLFWLSLAALLWTHAVYPATAALVARIAGKRLRSGDGTPAVAVIVAAHDEEAVIERWFTDRLVPLMEAGMNDSKSFYYAFRTMTAD